MVRDYHAAYVLQHWLAVLESNKRAIFSAAAHAQTAGDYLTAFQKNAAARMQERHRKKRTGVSRRPRFARRGRILYLSPV